MKGAFGEVRLVKMKGTGEYFAMKKLKKEDMARKEQIDHAWAERQVLVLADHVNVCKLVYAFQVRRLFFFSLASSCCAGTNVLLPPGERGR